MLAFARRRFGMLSFLCAMAALVCVPAGAQASGSSGCGAIRRSASRSPPGGTTRPTSWLRVATSRPRAGRCPAAPRSSPGASRTPPPARSVSTRCRVPAGASAESPSTCVDAAYPTVRMFVGGTGTVAVSVVYDGVAIPAGVAVAGGSWVAHAPMVTQSAILGPARRWHRSGVARGDRPERQPPGR